MEFYEVRFLDQRDSQIHSHYVMTGNMESAKTQIQNEEPYVRIVGYKKIREEDLPQLAIVIQK